MRGKRAALIVSCCLVAGGCGSSSGYAPKDLTTITPPPHTAAGGGSFTKPDGTPGAVVTMKQIAFSPATVRVRVGQTVEWDNRDNAVHNVTSLDGQTIASANFGTGGRFYFTTSKPGVFRYYCTIHASTMSGRLVVRR